MNIVVLHHHAVCCTVIVLRPAALHHILSGPVVLSCRVSSRRVRLRATLSHRITRRRVVVCSRLSLCISDVLEQSVTSSHRWGYICIRASESSWSEPAQ